MVPCGTPWGQWYQTLEEVFIEVQVPPGTRAQDIQCGLQSRHVALSVGGREILKVASQGLSRVPSLWPPRTPSLKTHGFKRDDYWVERSVSGWQKGSSEWIWPGVSSQHPLPELTLLGW